MPYIVMVLDKSGILYSAFVCFSCFWFEFLRVLAEQKKGFLITFCTINEVKHNLATFHLIFIFAKLQLEHTCIKVIAVMFFQLTELIKMKLIELFAPWEIFHVFFLSFADFLQNQLFRKILSEIPSEWQTD